MVIVSLMKTIFSFTSQSSSLFSSYGRIHRSHVHYSQHGKRAIHIRIYEKRSKSLLWTHFPFSFPSPCLKCMRQTDGMEENEKLLLLWIFAVRVVWSSQATIMTVFTQLDHVSFSLSFVFGLCVWMLEQWINGNCTAGWSWMNSDNLNVFIGF